MNYIDRVSIFVARHHADQKDVKALNGILKLSIDTNDILKLSR
jgi:hypothetical protein